jgi:hypothetical protein
MLAAGSLDQVIRVDDRVLLRTADAIHLLDRGGTIDLSRSFDAHTFDDPELSAMLTHMALDPSPRQDGTRRVVAAVMRDRADAPGDSLLVELSIGDSIELVRTATRVEAVELERVSISREGRVAALAEDAVVYLEEPDGSYSTRRLDDPDPSPKARSLLWIDDPARPLIATSRNRIHSSDPAVERFTAELVSLPNVMSLHLFAVAQREGELWLGGNSGYLAREESGVIEPIAIALPPRYIECSTAQGDLSLFEDDVLDLALSEGHAFALLSRCSALMAVRRSDGCVSLLSLDGSTPHIVDEDEEGLRSIDLQDGELVVTDAKSRAFRVDL